MRRRWLKEELSLGRALAHFRIVNWKTETQNQAIGQDGIRDGPTSAPLPPHIRPRAGRWFGDSGSLFLALTQLQPPKPDSRRCLRQQAGTDNGASIRNPLLSIGHADISFVSLVKPPTAVALATSQVSRDYASPPWAALQHLDIPWWLAWS